jgi:predicted SAM-dependent methyltransferase
VGKLNQLRTRLRAKVAEVPGARRAYFWAKLQQERTLRFERVSPEGAVRFSYEVMFGREPDPTGWANWLPMLQRGELSRRELVEMLRCSPEFDSPQALSARSLGPSIHVGRCRFIRSLPRAERIVDLGGTHLGDRRGAMVGLGYPYHFESLVIVDLPSDERHTIYQSAETAEVVETDKGPVFYRYHSMVDLSDFDDASVDLVYSGQSIEHVEPDEGRIVLKEVHRILRPGGRLALDTPNARVTRLQQPEFIDPDHKVEYTWPELRQMLVESGFQIESAIGLNYAGESLASGQFDAVEVASNCGFFDAVEDCYILAVVAAKLP